MSVELGFGADKLLAKAALLLVGLVQILLELRDDLAMRLGRPCLEIPGRTEQAKEDEDDKDKESSHGFNGCSLSSSSVV
ncbi:MAG TPA: hypothetical protein PLA50_05630 [Bacteroidia bacterium]|nr:hypothetical protein [Bacteroidia bacterium]